ARQRRQSGRVFWSRRAPLEPHDSVATCNGSAGGQFPSAVTCHHARSIQTVSGRNGGRCSPDWGIPSRTRAHILLPMTRSARFTRRGHLRVPLMAAVGALWLLFALSTTAAAAPHTATEWFVGTAV